MKPIPPVVYLFSLSPRYARGLFCCASPRRTAPVSDSLSIRPGLFLSILSSLTYTVICPARQGVSLVELSPVGAV
jgi:hypothetical protein